MKFKGLILYEDAVLPIKKILFWKKDYVTTVLSPQYDLLYR